MPEKLGATEERSDQCYSVLVAGARNSRGTIRAAANPRSTRCLLVGLPARHGFDVLCIHQQHLELLRENVPHWLPVHSSGLHGHTRHAALLEPIGKLKQIVSECPEALLLFTALPLGLSPQHTCGNTLLMYVQTTTAGDRQLPSRDSFPPRGVGRFEKSNISYACSPQLLEATIRCASQRPSHTRKRAL